MQGLAQISYACILQMYVDELPKDGNILNFSISKIDISPFRTCQRSFRLFHGNFSKDIHP